MLKRNPDAVALVLIVLLVAGSRTMIGRQDLKVQLRRDVASLKQCIRPVIHHNPIQRFL